MSNSLGVLEIDQFPSESPLRYMKRCEAARIVRRKLAEQLPDGKIRMLRVQRIAVGDSARFHRCQFRVVPALKAARKPENLLIYYPIKDQRTSSCA